jgi:hypothetical protein
MVRQLFHFRHYTQWSNSLFADYVRHFLRLKIEASGFPASVLTEEQKQQFVSAYKAMGVDIDPANVRYNPGLRFIRSKGKIINYY